MKPSQKEMKYANTDTIDFTLVQQPGFSFSLALCCIGFFNRHKTLNKIGDYCCEFIINKCGEDKIK